MATVDRHDLPLSVAPRSAFGSALFRLLHTKAKPENIIDDRAYDSDPLNEQLRRHGIETIAPHHSPQQTTTQDGRRFDGGW